MLTKLLPFLVLLPVIALGSYCENCEIWNGIVPVDNYWRNQINITNKGAYIARACWNFDGEGTCYAMSKSFSLGQTTSFPYTPQGNFWLMFDYLGVGWQAFPFPYGSTIYNTTTKDQLAYGVLCGELTGTTFDAKYQPLQTCPNQMCSGIGYNMTQPNCCGACWEGQCYSCQSGSVSIQQNNGFTTCTCPADNNAYCWHQYYNNYPCSSTSSNPAILYAAENATQLALLGLKKIRAT